MIKTLRCEETEKIFHGDYARKFPGEIQARALTKLRVLDVARQLEDLRIFPGNRLEKLKGDRQGQWSIRINEQWRICFSWKEQNAFDVEIVDYH